MKKREKKKHSEIQRKKAMREGERESESERRKEER